MTFLFSTLFPSVFPVVVPRCVPPGGWVEVLGPAFPPTRPDFDPSTRDFDPSTRGNTTGKSNGEK